MLNQLKQFGEITLITAATALGGCSSGSLSDKPPNIDGGVEVPDDGGSIDPNQDPVDNFVRIASLNAIGDPSLDFKPTAMGETPDGILAACTYQGLVFLDQNLQKLYPFDTIYCSAVTAVGTSLVVAHSGFDYQIGNPFISLITLGESGPNVIDPITLSDHPRYLKTLNADTIIMISETRLAVYQIINGVLKEISSLLLDSPSAIAVDGNTVYVSVRTDTVDSKIVPIDLANPSAPKIVSGGITVPKVYIHELITCDGRIFGAAGGSGIFKATITQQGLGNSSIFTHELVSSITSVACSNVNVYGANDSNVIGFNKDDGSFKVIETRRDSGPFSDFVLKIFKRDNGEIVTGNWRNFATYQDNEGEPTEITVPHEVIISSETNTAQIKISNPSKLNLKISGISTSGGNPHDFEILFNDIPKPSADSHLIIPPGGEVNITIKLLKPGAVTDTTIFYISNDPDDGSGFNGALTRVYANPTKKPGDDMPDVTLVYADKNGNFAGSTNFSGAGVLYFFAINCPPCQADLIEGDKIMQTYQGNLIGYAINGGGSVGQDAYQDIASFLAANGITNLPSVYDLGGELYNALYLGSISPFPFAVVSCGEGKFYKSYVGFHAGEIEKDIAAIIALGGDCPPG